MIRSPYREALFLAVLIAAANPSFGQEEEAEGKAWPLMMQAKTATVTMYQPQIDSWEDNDFEPPYDRRSPEWRCAQEIGPKIERYQKGPVSDGAFLLSRICQSPQVE